MSIYSYFYFIFLSRRRTVTTSGMSATSLEPCRIQPRHLRRTASNDQKNVNSEQPVRAFESTSRLHDNKYYTK